MAAWRRSDLLGPVARPRGESRDSHLLPSPWGAAPLPSRSHERATRALPAGTRARPPPPAYAASRSRSGRHRGESRLTLTPSARNPVDDCGRRPSARDGRLSRSERSREIRLTLKPSARNPVDDCGRPPSARDGRQSRQRPGTPLKPSRTPPMRACSGFTLRHGLGECTPSLASEFRHVSVSVGRILSAGISTTWRQRRSGPAWTGDRRPEASSPEPRRVSKGRRVWVNIERCSLGVST
jgi:hypothetical protein